MVGTEASNFKKRAINMKLKNTVENQSITSPVRIERQDFVPCELRIQFVQRSPLDPICPSE